MTLRSPLPGLTLTQYAAAKRLSADFLRTIGLSDATYDGQHAVRISFFGATGELLAVRFQIALDGDRFRWKSGGAKRHPLYGLSRLNDARKFGAVVLADDELSCHTLWSHGVPALGVLDWVEERDAQHLNGIEKIYVVIEPDDGGVKQKWLARSIIRHRVNLIKLEPSAVHLEDSEQFKARWQVVCLAAAPWQAIEAKLTAEARFEAWQRCGVLAQKANILDEFATDLARVGLVGERRGAKLLYLAVTSRLLDRPVSTVVKGPSSGGKSFVVESVLRFFPSEAFYTLTAMSERALVYSQEPLKNRMLVIFETGGVTSELTGYLIRSLLSENRLRYETPNGLIEREGPTGLILTATALRLHPENETRMLSLTVTDTKEQTEAVLRRLAAQDDGDQGDFSRWHTLQTWLATGPFGVTIPFAGHLAELVPPVAIRLRRDFKLVLMLIQAHALLHQASRRKDETGRIVATLADYTAVRILVGDLMAEGVDAQVKSETREVVEAVRKLLVDGREEVRQVDLLPHLKLDKSAISRRIGAAIDGGFLRNRERGRYRPARLI